MSSSNVSVCAYGDAAVGAGGPATLDANISTTDFNNKNWYFGWPATNDGFNGSLAELRLYSQGLTTAQLTIVARDQPPIRCWSLHAFNELKAKWAITA